MQEVIFWGIWAVLGLIMLLYYLRRKRRVLSLLVGAGSGLLALLVVHYGGSFGWHFTCAESAASGTVCCAWRTWCDTDGRAAFYTVNNKKRGHLIKRCPRILSRIDFVRKLTSVR